MVSTSKIFEKFLWKSDTLSKDAGQDPASLLKCHYSAGVFEIFC